MIPADQQALLRYAHLCVNAVVRDASLPAMEVPSPALAASGAAFVTLRVSSELRGCVGHIQAAQALWESVRDMASAAATRDHRFEPIRPGEEIVIDISVLSPMFVLRAEDVRIGTHGLYVKRGLQTGLLLPHVAVEAGWTPSRFLEQTCKKAGLPLDAWADPAVQLFGFTTEHFGDLIP